MRRLLVVVMGVLLAGVCGMVALVVGVLADASLLRAETAIGIVSVSGLIAAALRGGTDAHLLGIALQLAWGSVVAVCFLPVAIAAVVGEAVRTASFVWYGTVSGALAAAVPTLARALGALPPARVTTFEARVTLVLFLAGVAAGLFYWLVAARTPDVAAR